MCFSVGGSADPDLSVPEGSARKGRTKKEASDNTNRPNPAGHERKIVEKLQNSEKKAKE